MLFVDSIEKLCECNWHAPKNNNVCQRSESCGYSLVFLWHIYEQSCYEPRKLYLRNISSGFRDFYWHSGSSDADVATISASITNLLVAKCES